MKVSELIEQLSQYDSSLDVTFESGKDLIDVDCVEKVNPDLPGSDCTGLRPIIVLAK